MTSFKEGDIVQFIRKPTKEDWKEGSSSTEAIVLHFPYTVTIDTKRGGKTFIRIKELQNDYFPECVLEKRNDYDIF